MKWTDDDEKQPGQFEPGAVYPFEVVEAEERTSQAGNQYINLKLLVFVDGSERVLYDNLMPQMKDKMRSFCEVCELMDQYKSKNLSPSDCENGQGYVRMSKKEDKRGYLQAESYLAKQPPKAGKSESAEDPDERMLKPRKNRSTETVSEDGVPF